MNHAVILGGTGALGRATTSKLLSEGWTVDVVGRNAENFPAELRDAGAQFRSADRYNSADLQAVLGAGADLLVDALSFTEAHAKMLLPHLSGFSSAAMLSSKAVYQDEQGRHANSDEPPQFSGPIPEEQATLPAQNSDFASREGYGPNKVAAEQLLLDSGYPVTVIRASKVHGIGTAQAREWVFVKRILDERKTVFLARAVAISTTPRRRGIPQPLSNKWLESQDGESLIALIRTLLARWRSAELWRNILGTIGKRYC